MAFRSLVRRHVPHQPGTPVLEFAHVTVRYNGSAEPALDDVSFSLERGERTAIVGPNGAGKSTLLKVVAGILTPSAGRVNIYGQESGGHTCIGYVPQRTQVDWNFPVTVADVVLMGRVARLGLFRQAGRKDREIARASLAQVHMEHLAGRQIGELSGGQQQRVFIARAMAQEADLLLMDEPLTGLDIPAQEAIFAVLDELKSRGMTVLVSTHDLHLAGERFDRLMLLRRRLLGFGAAAEVLTSGNLRRAYGAQMTMLPSAEGTLVFGDTCCEGQGEPEAHSHEEHSHA